MKDYASVLLHEIIHAKTETNDVTREFEEVLTQNLGILVEKIL